MVGFRHLAIVRVLRGAALAAVITDVETRKIGGRPLGSSRRVAEFDPLLPIADRIRMDRSRPEAAVRFRS
jgi:hypothetical protein